MFSLAFKRCCQTEPSVGTVCLLFCILPAFHPLLSNKCLKCHRTHQPAFCIVHLWLFICLLVMTCCKSGKEGKQWNCVRPKVTSELEGHCHSKSPGRVSLMGAGRGLWREGLSVFLSVKGQSWGRLTQGQRPVLCWVRHPGRGAHCETPGNLGTAALWDRVRGEKK